MVEPADESGPLQAATKQPPKPALGATGSSGRMTVRIAKLLGADKVVAAGRDPQRLAELPAFGATATVRLDEAEPEGTCARRRGRRRGRRRDR